MNEVEYHVEVWADEQEKLVFNLFKDLGEYKANLTINEVKNLDIENEPNEAIARLSRFFKNAVELKKRIIERDKEILALKKRIVELEEEKNDRYTYEPTTDVIISNEYIEQINNEMKIYLDFTVAHEEDKVKKEYGEEVCKLLKRHDNELGWMSHIYDEDGNVSYLDYEYFIDKNGLFGLIKNELKELDKALVNESYIPHLTGLFFYSKLYGKMAYCENEYAYETEKELNSKYYKSSGTKYIKPSEKKITKKSRGVVRNEDQSR